MGIDTLILLGIGLCQAATGYWAFHVSTSNKRARSVFAVVTAIGIGLVFWSGNRAENESVKFQNMLEKIARSANVNPALSPDQIADAVSKKLRVPVVQIKAGTTYNVPTGNYVINVENGTDALTEVYLPKNPFQGESILVQDVRTDNSTAMIDIWGSGHKVGGRNRTFIITHGSGYQKMIFDGQNWSATGIM